MITHIALPTPGIEPGISGVQGENHTTRPMRPLAYSIFKVNSNCKFEEKNYNNIQLLRYICEYLKYYTNVVLDIEKNPLIIMYVGRIVDSLQDKQ